MVIVTVLSVTMLITTAVVALIAFLIAELGAQLVEALRIGERLADGPQDRRGELSAIGAAGIVGHGTDPPGVQTIERIHRGVPPGRRLAATQHADANEGIVTAAGMHTFQGSNRGGERPRPSAGRCWCRRTRAAPGVIASAPACLSARRPSIHAHGSSGSSAGCGGRTTSSSPCSSSQRYVRPSGWIDGAHTVYRWNDWTMSIPMAGSVANVVPNGTRNNAIPEPSVRDDDHHVIGNGPNRSSSSLSERSPPAYTSTSRPTTSGGSRKAMFPDQSNPFVDAR